MRLSSWSSSIALIPVCLTNALTYTLYSFGGFATKYIKGKFFMDVHPPLAKMLIALTGWLAGFDGSFDFKEIGKDYIEPGVPYVAMRMFPAICGILLIPCMFFTLKAVGCRTMTATMGAGLIIFGSYPSYPHPFAVKTLLLTMCRERSSDSGPPDPPRFASCRRDRFHSPRLLLLHEPTRAWPYEGFPAELVVLACSHRSWSGYHREHQVGWTLHNCLGWIPYASSALGSSR